MAANKTGGGGGGGVGWGGAGVAYRWREEERMLLYGINGHIVRLCGRREGRGDGLLHGGCGGGGGWLGETTVAGERERRVREGGRLVKPRISMKTPSVFLFSLAVVTHC